MDFRLNEEQTMLKDIVRKFVEKERLLELAKEHDEAEEYPNDLHKKCADLGWLGLCIPEQYGGSTSDLMTLFLLIEELSRGALIAGNIIFRNVVNAGLAILRNGTEGQRQFFLPKIVKGELIFAFSMTEPSAGSDAAALITSAVKDGDNFIVNGNKVFCTGARVADYVQLLVRTAKSEKKYEGISILLVDTKTPGITIHKIKKMVNKGMETNEIFFDNVKVPGKNLLGKLNEGWKNIIKTLAFERIFVAAMCIGVTQRVMEDAVQYSKEREQFGRPIGKFQVIRHRLADMQVRLDAARLLCYRAVWLIQEGLPYDQAVSIAKLVASETYARNSSDAMRILGGYGLTMEYDMQRYFRDAREFIIGAGTSDIMRNIIAKQMGL